jgi:hypothetical protein
MTAARRLAAILAADVVGSLRLMGEDKGGRGTPRGFIAVPLGAWSVDTSWELHKGTGNARLRSGPPKKGENTPGSVRTFR